GRRHTRFSRDWSSDVCSSDLGPPPHDRGAGAAGPLLLAVPTDSATSAAPRPCAVPQTLGQDQRRGVLAGQVLEGDVDCALRAPIDRKSTRLNSSHVKISYTVC